MKTIIIDNFLEEETFNTIKNTANGNDIKWVTQLSNSELKDFTFFDMGEMIREKEEWLELKNTNIIFSIFEKITTHIDDGGLCLSRVYFNRQKPTVDGQLHLDDGQYTALLYVSDYEKEWGGFTQLWHSDSEQEYVLPIPNRLVIFPASIYHKGFSFSHVWNPDRISLAFKIGSLMNMLT